MFLIHIVANNIYLYIIVYVIDIVIVFVIDIVYVNFLLCIYVLHVILSRKSSEVVRSKDKELQREKMGQYGAKVKTRSQTSAAPRCPIQKKNVSFISLCFQTENLHKLSENRLFKLVKQISYTNLFTYILQLF